MLAHEIEQEAMERALEQVDEEAQQRSAASVAEKYARQYARLPREERDEMVIRRLLSRGYSYDDARAALAEATGEMET